MQNLLAPKFLADLVEATRKSNKSVYTAVVLFANEDEGCEETSFPSLSVMVASISQKLCSVASSAVVVGLRSVELDIVFDMPEAREVLVDIA